MEALECLLTRRSVRKYSSKPVEQDKIDKIIEAGLYAASGKGTQNPIIIEVIDKKIRDEIAALNNDIGGWPKGHDPFYGAPVILVVLCRKDASTGVEDGSLVLGNMMLAAHDVGLSSCWIHRAKEEFEGEYGKALLERIGLEPDLYRGVGHLALGYGEVADPAPAPRKEKRVYKI